MSAGAAPERAYLSYDLVVTPMFNGNFTPRTTHAWDGALLTCARTWFIDEKPYNLATAHSCGWHARWCAHLLPGKFESALSVLRFERYVLRHADHAIVGNQAGRKSGPTKGTGVR
jgi:hypothetical protein